MKKSALFYGNPPKQRNVPESCKHNMEVEAREAAGDWGAAIDISERSEERAQSDRLTISS